jgi:signal transduction histidine kinase
MSQITFDSELNQHEIICQKNKEIEQLKRKLIDLENIVSLMPGNVYWKDKQGEFLGCNNNVAEILKLPTRHDIIGKTNHDLFGKELADITTEVDNLAMSSQSEQCLEEIGLDINGNHAIYLTRKLPFLNENNEVVGLLGISVDITDRKKVEDLEKGKKLAEEKVQVMKMLAGSIAHELRTPLATLNICSSTLSKHMPFLLHAAHLAVEHNLVAASEVPRYINHVGKIPDSIKYGVISCNQIIDMLLMNIREGGISQNEFESSSISECIHEALAEYAFDVGERELAHCQFDQDFHYYGKSLLTKHILFNLLKNAFYFIKYANKGNVIIQLRNDVAGNQLVFRDTGAGVPVEVLPKIFDRFFSQCHGGTGLGLAFCQMVMQAYGGDIICRSEKGEFTEFVLTFPPLKS